MNYNSLKATINADIKQNGNQEITGIVMNSVLNAMVNALAASGMTFGGAITPSTPVPTNIDQATAFLAPGAGTYEHFLDSNGDPIVVTSPSLIMYDGGQALIFTSMTLPFPQVLSVYGGDSLCIAIPAIMHSYRIDMTAVYNSGEAGTETRWIGSLVIECENLNNYKARGYYYGDEMDSILQEVAIWKDDPDGQNYYLILTANSDLDSLIFSISSLDGKDVQVIDEPDDIVKVADATITPVGSGGGDGKIGVISQTQTWSGSGSNPRTYVMSDQVTGLIPQANIDLFESAGATFNATTGYFELNGLTDISYEEMQVIYEHPIRNASDLINEGIFPVKQRTTLPLSRWGASQSINSSMAFANGSMLEVVDLSTFHTYPLRFTAYASFFTGCVWLREIIGSIRIIGGMATTAIFTNCYSLEKVYQSHIERNTSFAQSSLLSLASVVYMVENAANTSAITITLHASAYARCQADTTEYTWQGNTYTGIIALATAKNITIASA